MCAFFLLGAGAKSCGSGTDTKENQTGSGGATVGRNQPLLLKGTQYTVKRARVAQSVGDEFNRANAPAGTVFAIVTVTLVNKKNETHTISTDAMKFVGRSGKSYSPDTDASVAGQGTLILEEIQPDVPKTGNVIFAVPRAQIHGSKLRVEDFFSDAHGFIRLGL
jgi:hypothetical protein